MKYLIIEPASISIEKGKKQQLKATYNEDGYIRHDMDISWSSKSPEVVSVDPRGMVTGLKSGSALIVARANGEQTSTIVSVKRAIHDLGEESDLVEEKEIVQDTVEVKPSKKKDTYVSSSTSTPDIPLLSLFDMAENQVVEESKNQLKINTTVSSAQLINIVEALASEHVEIKNVKISQNSKVHSNIDPKKRAVSITLSLSMNLKKDD